MIDFRYHLVSIVAVFMALAIGIVLGSGPLREPITAGLKNQTQQLAQDKAEQRSQIRDLERHLSYAQSFASKVGPDLVGDRLLGQSVVLVTFPGTSGRLTTSVRSELTLAGARVTGQVAVAKKFTDPQQVGVLDDLARRLAPPTTVLPTTEDPYTRVAAVLGDAILTPQTTVAGAPDAAGAEVLAGLREAGFLDLSGSPSRRASLAVMVASDAPAAPDDAVAAADASLVTLAAGLDARASGSVLVGAASSAAKGGLVSALRSSTTASQRVSTVDTVDTPEGLVAVVYALVEQNRDSVGHYGSEDGASGVLPDLSGPVKP